MDTLKSQIEAMTSEEWTDFLAWVVGPERQRREALPLIEETRAEDRDTLWETHPELRPDFETGAPEEVAEGTLFPAYVQPLGAHDCYPLGAGVSEGGRNYVSLHPANVWPPSTPHPGLWREVPVKAPDPAPEEPEEPSDETDSPVDDVPPYVSGVPYDAGSRFTWEGRTWEVLQAHTSAAHWPPDQAPSLYKAVN